jgi:hypothetical protein
MKKPKTLEVKLRSAIRLIWSRSAERRAIIKANSYKGVQSVHLPPDPKGQYFQCPLCPGKREWPVQFGEVDHEPPIGTLESWRDSVAFIEKMFFGPQRLVCKNCHKAKTAMQRRKR